MASNYRNIFLTGSNISGKDSDMVGFNTIELRYKMTPESPEQSSIIYSPAQGSQQGGIRINPAFIAVEGLGVTNILSVQSNETRSVICSGSYVDLKITVTDPAIILSSLKVTPMSSGFVGKVKTSIGDTNEGNVIKSLSLSANDAPIIELNLQLPSSNIIFNDEMIAARDKQLVAAVAQNLKNGELVSLRDSILYMVDKTSITDQIMSALNNGADYGVLVSIPGMTADKALTVLSLVRQSVDASRVKNEAGINKIISNQTNFANFAAYLDQQNINILPNRLATLIRNNATLYNAAGAFGETVQ